MRKLIQISFVLIFFVSASDILNAQTAWMRVASDNGEFSVEVPQIYDFFYDKSGFIVSNGSTASFKLAKAHIFTSFQEKTLISFECYETGKSGADLLIEIDKQRHKLSEASYGTIKIKQFIDKTGEYYLIRQYFRSKNFIYLITAASRNGETPQLKRFLDSIKFTPEAAIPLEESKSNFSKLNISNVEIKMSEESKDKTQTTNVSTPPADPKIISVQVLTKPRVSYLDSARMNAVQGEISFKTTLNDNGFIPKFEVIKTLPEGLLRQSIFSALRIRFLPAEDGGTAKAVKKEIKYNFSLY